MSLEDISLRVCIEEESIFLPTVRSNERCHFKGTKSVMAEESTLLGVGFSVASQVN